MTLQIAHSFQTAQAQSANSNLVSRSAWNEAHSMTMTGPAVVGKVDAGAGAAAEIGPTINTGHVFRESGGQIGWGNISASVVDGVVTSVSIGNIQVSASNLLVGRVVAGSGSVSEISLHQALDFLGTTVGQILYKATASTWAPLSPGTSGQLLSSQSVGVAPKYVDPPSGGVSGAPARLANSAFQVTSNDNDKIIAMSGYYTVSLMSISSLGNTFRTVFRNRGGRRINLATSGTETIDGAASIPIFPGQGFAVYGDGSSALYSEGRPVRWRRTTEDFWANATTGDTTADGLSSDASMTVNAALAFMRNQVDLGGTNCILRLLAGTYSNITQMAGLWTGHHNIEIHGDSTNPTSVVIAIGNNETGIYASDLARVVVRYLTTSGTTGATHIKSEQFAVIGLDRVTLNTGNVGVRCTINGAFKTNGPVTVAGSWNEVFFAEVGGRLELGANVSINTACSVDFFAIAQDLGVLNCDAGIAFVGAGVAGTSGNRYLARRNGVIQTNTNGNSNFFPGSIAGTSSTGGLYA